MVVITAAYVVALAVALLWLTWGPSVGQLWADTLIADVLATLVIFVVSRAVGNSSCYDAYWSVVPVFLALYWWFAGDAIHGGSQAKWRCALLGIVLVIWAVRLTANWVRSFPGLVHEDWRYELLRRRAGRFSFVADLFAIHLIPTLQVFLAMIPAYVALTRADAGLMWLSVVAFVVGLAAIALESIADRQLRLFRRSSKPGQTVDIGLWAWSRHPNYFGEFMFWVSILLFGIAAAPADAWWLWVGAGAMLAMFLGASIPMMEERSLERRPSYADVIDRVPKFLPLPRLSSRTTDGAGRPG